MFFYGILSFLLFINSYDSLFIGINKYKPMNKLVMGYDYYVEKNLYIYYKDNSIQSLNVKKDKRYYYELDRDRELNISSTDSCNEIREKLKKYHLEYVEPPVLVYSNNSFTNAELSKRYKMILEYEMTNHDYKKWDDIKDVVLMEERYQRE